MDPFVMVAEAGAAEVAPSTETEVNAVLPMIKAGVTGVFDMATSAYDFLLSAPLCAFMIGSGFAFMALGLVRKALRIGKRV